jgi:hypothetical protein
MQAQRKEQDAVAEQHRQRLLVAYNVCTKHLMLIVAQLKSKHLEKLADACERSRDEVPECIAERLTQSDVRFLEKMVQTKRGRLHVQSIIELERNQRREE